MRHRSAALLVGMAALAAISGCASSPGTPPSGCVPARMAVSPATAAPGDVITVAAPPAGCALDLRAGTAFELRLQPGDARAPFARTRVVLAEDGSFSTTMMVPEDFPAGRGTVFLVNDDVVEWCPGYSMPIAAASVVDASCAAYEATVTIDGS